MTRPARRAIALFAKNPVSEAVKTRLVPPLTFAQAAELAMAFLTDAGAALIAFARDVDARPCVFFTPATARAAIRAYVPEAVETFPQAGSDLAQRLINAYATLADEGISDVCFLGADSPTLPRAYVAAAFEALEAGSETAIGPASDGGYYLIAMRRAYPQIFERIDWSTSRVFAQTRERAAENGISMHTLPAWYDVDDATGLARLRMELLDPRARVARGEPAPRTKAFLTSLMASDRMP